MVDYADLWRSPKGRLVPGLRQPSAGNHTISCRSRWTVLPGVLLVLLVGYWLLLRFVPVPGFGVPGVDVPFLDPTHNLAFWLDNRLFAGHLLHGSSDPNGLLSTIPAVGTFLIGMIIGLWLKTSHTLTQKATGLVAAGCASLAAGGLWSRELPDQHATVDQFLCSMGRRMDSSRAGIALYRRGCSTRERRFSDQCCLSLVRTRWRASFSPQLSVHAFLPFG